MWNRQELKARGKAAFKANYWRCVLVALIMAALLGGGVSAGKDRLEDAFDDLDELNQYESVSDFQADFRTDEDVQVVMDILEDPTVSGPVLAIVGGIMAVVALIAIAIDVLLANPLQVSCCNFFTRNADQPAALDELSRGFKPEWLHNVATLLLRDLFIFLWSLLLVVPGIIKVYAYRMVPYIMAEHPEMSGTEAITLSRAMMNGQKWNAFVFDLSFLGWELLSGITAGIVGIFYVNPYKYAADAELYLAISEGYFGGGESTALPEF